MPTATGANAGASGRCWQGNASAFRLLLPPTPNNHCKGWVAYWLLLTVASGRSGVFPAPRSQSLEKAFNNGGHHGPCIHQTRHRATSHDYILMGTGGHEFGNLVGFT